MGINSSTVANYVCGFGIINPMKSEIKDGDGKNTIRTNQGIDLFFGRNRIHLDPVEILLFCLLGLPIGIMIRDAPQTTFDDAIKRIAIVMGATAGIRKFPTDKIYERLLSISFDNNTDEDE